MAFDAFMQITDIPGESTDQNHNDWIEINSFTHSVIQPTSASASSSGGASAERANFSTFDITKDVDKSSPKLYEASFTGTHIKEIVLQFCRAGGTKEKYLEVKMEEVLVTSYTQSGGEANKDGFPVEHVSFAPGKIKMTYSQQKRENGTGGGVVEAGWDLTKNKKYA